MTKSNTTMTPQDIAVHLAEVRRRVEDIPRSNLLSIGSWRSSKAGRLAIFFLLISAAFIGGTGGFLVGASSTPVVNTVLPLLLILLGGSGGIYVARLDLELRQSQIKMTLVGAATIAMMLPFVVALAVGISLRLDQKQESRVPIPEHHLIKDLIEFALLERKLEIIGIAESRKHEILAAAADQIDIQRGYIRTEQISKTHSDASKALKQLLDIANKSTDKEIQKELKKAIGGLKIFIRFLSPWRQRDIHPKGMPFDLYKRAVSNIWFHLDSLSIPTWVSISTWQIDFAKSDNPVHRIYRDLYEVTGRIEPLWTESSNGMDDIIRFELGKATKQTDKIEIMPAAHE